MLNNNMLRPAAQEDAFTLVELLMVILIIGVLAAIAVPMFLNQRTAAHDAAVKSDVKNAGVLLEGQVEFDGSLTPDTKTSDGVTLTAMRLSERNNQVESSQFVDGNSTSWGTFRDPRSTGHQGVQVFTNPADGYEGMNYRRQTIVGSSPRAGQYVNIVLPEAAKKGDTFTVGVAMRHNYTGTRDLGIEFRKGTLFLEKSPTRPVSFTANEWDYHTFTATATSDGAERIVMIMYGPMGDRNTFDVTGAVAVKGDQLDPEGALNGRDFCVQGSHESNPDNYWRYSNLHGGLENKKC